MKTRENSSRDSRRESSDSKRSDNSARSEDLKLRFTEQDQELAAETVVRSDNPNAD